MCPILPFTLLSDDDDGGLIKDTGFSVFSPTPLSTTNIIPKKLHKNPGIK